MVNSEESKHDFPTMLSCVRLFVTPWTVASQAPPSMGFSRQEYWSGLPFPSPGDLSNPGIEPGRVSHIPGRRFNLWATREAHDRGWYMLKKKYTEVGEELEDQM